MNIQMNWGKCELSDTNSTGFMHHCGTAPLKNFLARFPWDLQKSSLIHIQNLPGIQHRTFGSATSTIIQRNPFFSTINHDDIIYFENKLGMKNVIQDEEELQTANTDWMHKYKGSSKLMLLPENTDQVCIIFPFSKVVSYAVFNHI